MNEPDYYVLVYFIYLFICLKEHFTDSTFKVHYLIMGDEIWG